MAVLDPFGTNVPLLIVFSIHVQNFTGGSWLTLTDIMNARPYLWEISNANFVLLMWEGTPHKVISSESGQRNPFELPSHKAVS